jgi:regulator of CtrA degradation
MQEQGAPRIFSKTFEEAMGLLIESRDYIALEEKIDRGPLGIAEQLCTTLETTRLTSRVINLMTWFLARRAVHEGEIDMEVFLDEYRLDQRSVLASNDEGTLKGLSENLVDLMERSEAFYQRVSRLDALTGNTSNVPDRTNGDPSLTIH